MQSLKWLKIRKNIFKCIHIVQSNVLTVGKYSYYEDEIQVLRY